MVGLPVTGGEGLGKEKPRLQIANKGHACYKAYRSKQKRDKSYTYLDLLLELVPKAPGALQHPANELRGAWRLRTGLSRKVCALGSSVRRCGYGHALPGWGRL